MQPARTDSRRPDPAPVASGYSLIVRDLHVHLRSRHGTVHAVNGISFAVKPGEILGIVGESGSGKSVAMLAVMGFFDREAARLISGSVTVGGTEWRELAAPDPWSSRSPELAIIFQDAVSSLNPVLTVGSQMTDTLMARQPKSGGGMPRPAARRRAAELLDLVRIPDAARCLDLYPHQLSGGMCQRVMIAMAISADPSVLIADEPTTALDVTVQSQILDVLLEIRQRTGMSIVMISHDFGVIARVADRVQVMYAGRIVERGGVDDIFSRPQHPYTRALLACSPRIDRGEQASQIIPGAPPDMRLAFAGCPFAARCAEVMGVCRRDEPALRPVGSGAVLERHAASCWLPRIADAGNGDGR